MLDTVAKRDAGLNQTVVAAAAAGHRSRQRPQRHRGVAQNIDNLANNSALLLQQIRPYLPSDITNLGKIANTLNTTRNCPGYIYPVTNEPKYPQHPAVRQELLERPQHARGVPQAGADEADPDHPYGDLRLVLQLLALRPRAAAAQTGSDARRVDPASAVAGLRRGTS